MCVSVNVCERERDKGREREREGVCVCVCVRSVCACVLNVPIYGVATISRLFEIIGLFCRLSSLLSGSFAKETYNLKEPTNRSHPVSASRKDSFKETLCLKNCRHLRTSVSPTNSLV